MTMEYIRKTYHVPAKRGGRVRYTGGPTPIDGTITSASGPYIRVRLDDRKMTVRLHPTWEVQYIAEGKTERGGPQR